VLQIPASSLFRDGNGLAAFALDDGKAVKRRVEIGQRSGLTAQVLSGIGEGESVVVHPDDQLREGVRVASR
jgi:HlyD family secretion protein